MNNLRQAAQQLVDRIDREGSTPLDWREYDALRAALAESEQEPVAWMEMVVANLVREGINKHKARELAHHFATPPQRKPLTVKEINALPEAKGHWPIGMNDRIVRLIRAVESAHGIREGT